jgi:hypothetical protein
VNCRRMSSRGGGRTLGSWGMCRTGAHDGSRWRWWRACVGRALTAELHEGRSRECERFEVVCPDVGEFGVVINARDADQISSGRLLCSATFDVNLTIRSVNSTEDQAREQRALTRNPGKTGAGSHHGGQYCQVHLSESAVLQEIQKSAYSS